MVSRILIAVIFATIVPVCGWGKTGQSCLSCHPVHFVAHGECRRCHLGNPASARKNIAHVGLRAGKYARFILYDSVQMKRGELFLEQFACRRCHISNGRGNRLAISLDTAAKLKTAAELAFSIHNPVGAMPNFMVTEEQTIMLVNTILAGSQGQKSAYGKPVAVHFSTPKNKGVDLFSQKCGSCHKVLSRQSGALGTGNMGPNLSGIFTIYYPRSFKGNDAWTAQSIKTWLNNPREVKPLAQMRPVMLKDTELKALVSILNVVD